MDLTVSVVFQVTPNMTILINLKKIKIFFLKNFWKMLKYLKK